MDDFIEFLKFGVCVIVGAFCVVLGVVGIGAVAESYSCRGYQEATGKATKYTALECYVQDGGAWYSWAEYKHRLVTKGEMPK